ncbi:hypothetical protein DPEC_G00083660 [Dallia pectoralis]|uniref:Uncharacterized protein n=1 Tax=Dallia pectoralis TaxID=75939 RepID=A0ACC2GZ93_DALPE|nr:hypothetical protein DPEC_G00083660 [Dallia pectoralis]
MSIVVHDGDEVSHSGHLISRQPFPTQRRGRPGLNHRRLFPDEVTSRRPGRFDNTRRARRGWESHNPKCSPVVDSRLRNVRRLLSEPTSPPRRLVAQVIKGAAERPESPVSPDGKTEAGSHYRELFGMYCGGFVMACRNEPRLSASVFPSAGM